MILGTRQYEHTKLCTNQNYEDTRCIMVWKYHEKKIPCNCKSIRRWSNPLKLIHNKHTPKSNKVFRKICHVCLEWRRIKGVLPLSGFLHDNNCLFHLCHEIPFETTWSGSKSFDITFCFSYFLNYYLGAFPFKFCRQLKRKMTPEVILLILHVSFSFTLAIMTEFHKALFSNFLGCYQFLDIHCRKCCRSRLSYQNLYQL